jgi:hypothetical protein
MRWQRCYHCGQIISYRTPCEECCDIGIAAASIGQRDTVVSLSKAAKDAGIKPKLIRQFARIHLDLLKSKHQRVIVVSDSSTRPLS